MSKRPLKILVGGYLIGFPLGGMFWLALSYLLGLKRLGHEVLFLEDTGMWNYPFDPERGMYDVDSSYGRDLIQAFFSRFGLADRWCYYSEFEGQHYGRSREELEAYCAEADLLLNISGILPQRDLYFDIPRRLLLDTDPVWTMYKASLKQKDLEYLKRHTHFFTFGYHLPKGNTPVPLFGLDWQPTLPPALLDEWRPAPGPGGSYTTVGNWDVRDREIVIGGKRYSWRKAVQFEKIIELPRRLPEVRFELSYSGMEEDQARYNSFGWNVQNGMLVSKDLWTYHEYIRNSRAEFTVAKQQNIELKSGWVSDRAVTYLAAGRPVLTQDCGYEEMFPVGKGLLTFEDLESAERAVRDVEANYEAHRAAARQLAEEYFASDKVLASMLAACGL